MSGKASRSTIGKRSKRKGAHFECEVVNLLRDAGVEDIYTTRSRQSRSDDIPDIEGTTWAIECGTGKKVNPCAKLCQAEAAAERRGDNRPCVAVCRHYGAHSITATMRLHSACIDCETDDDADVVTMPVEDWIKRVVRQLAEWKMRVGRKPITVADFAATEPVPGVRCEVEIKAQAGRAAS
jgi:hypothetical protein